MDAISRECTQYPLSSYPSRRIQLARLRPHISGSRRLSYEVVKLSNNGGGNPIISRSLTVDGQNGMAVSNGIDGKGGDEWPKVQDAAQSLREVLEDDSEPTGDSNSRRRSDDELAEELFGVLSR